MDATPVSVARTLALALLVLIAVPARAVAPELLQPQTQQYLVYRGGSELGEGRIQLRAAENSPDCYFYTQEAFPRAWLRWLSGNVLEQSHFCIHDGAIRPVAFRYSRSGVGSSKENYSLRFDWTKREVTYQDGQVRALEDGMLDRLSIQLQLRNWILTEKARTGQEPAEEHEVVFPDRKRIERYRFQIKAHERIETPGGVFETVRLDRTDNPKRRTQFWLAPQQAYAVIKAEQQKEDDPLLRLLLSKPLQTPKP